jgi:hypothetical protein
MVALPLVAVVVLDASDFAVTLVSAFAALAGALVALPLGTAVEYRRKRPTMATAWGVRPALWIGAAGLATSALLLPTDSGGATSDGGRARR